MPRKPPTCVMTYNHPDGACAAAVCLLAEPGAELHPTSAKRVGYHLEQLAERKTPPTTIHICGVGVFCERKQVEDAVAAMREKIDTRVVWHCGRGYLDENRDWFERFCEPSFLDAGSNTAATAKHFGLSGGTADFLVGLSMHDEKVLAGAGADAASREKNAEQEKWLGLIEASIAQYFKFRDCERYKETIRKLAERRMDAADERLIAAHGAYGYRYQIQGRSRIVSELCRDISRVAEVDRSVVITGESGVGKEHVARLIHERSGKRSTAEMRIVNCAGFLGNVGLANSELFGHKKGAFSGAEKDRPGAFREADGGILFLDELGELPLEVQAKLLRVIEDGMITPLGADAPDPPEGVDVRLIAATNRNLPSMIRTGDFRADLFHRLATLRIEVPPLRARLRDIPDILHGVLHGLARDGCSRTLTDDDVDELRSYDWPGNVRQLIKVVERSVFLDKSVGEIIAEERALGDLRPEEDADADGPDPLRPRRLDEAPDMEEARRIYVRRVLDLCEGNKTEAAERLGVTRSTLRKYLSEEDDG